MKRVFIVGCPRSGSTWITFLLAQHPKVATFQHAKLFDYLVRVRDWHRLKAGASFVVDPHENGDPARAETGSRSLVDFLRESELAPLLGQVAAGVVDSVAALRPGVEVVVDKTPENGHQAGFIREILPDAWFLHVVRDPRSVFCSLRSAASSWARWEFPTQSVDGARFWRRDVETARAIGDATDRYLEVRYEDVEADPAAQLARLFDRLGLEADADLCAAAVEASSKARVSETKELPRGFVRKTPAGGWRDELSRSDTRVIEHLAGDLMERLGYERTLPAGGTPFRVRWHDWTDPLFAFLETRLRRATQLAHWRWVGRKLEWPDP